MGLVSTVKGLYKSGKKKVKSAAKTVTNVAEKVVDAVDKITDNDVSEYLLNAGGTLVGVPTLGTTARKAVNATQGGLDTVDSAVSGDYKSIANKAVSKLVGNKKSALSGFSKMIPKTVRDVADNSFNNLSNIGDNVEKITGKIQFKDMSNYVTQNKNAFIQGVMSASHASDWLSKRQPSDLVKSLFL